MSIFGKRKEYEQRISQLESELSIFKQEAEKALQSEREQKKELEDRIVLIQNKSDETIEEEKKRSENAIKEAAEKYEAALREEKKRFNDTLISLREHIYSEKDELNRLPEKELIVRTLMGLGGFGGRLDRIEKQYEALIHNVNEEIMGLIHSECESILNRFQSANSDIINSMASANEGLISAYKTRTTEMQESFITETQKMQMLVRSDTNELKKEINKLEAEVKTSCDNAIKTVKEAVNPYENSTLKTSIDQIKEVLNGIDESIDVKSIYSISVDIDNLANKLQYVTSKIIDESSCDDDSIYEMTKKIKNDTETIKDIVTGDNSYSGDLYSTTKDIKDIVTGNNSYSGDLYSMTEDIKQVIRDVQSNIEEMRN